MRFTLFALPGRPVHSDTNSASPGSILAMQQVHATTKSLTFPPLSIARYSFIQLSQLWRQWRQRKCPIFKTVAKGDSNPGSLDCESGILPMSYRAPQRSVGWGCCRGWCSGVTNRDAIWNEHIWWTRTLQVSRWHCFVMRRKVPCPEVPGKRRRLRMDARCNDACMRDMAIAWLREDGVTNRTECRKHVFSCTGYPVWWDKPVTMNRKTKWMRKTKHYQSNWGNCLLVHVDSIEPWAAQLLNKQY